MNPAHLVTFYPLAAFTKGVLNRSEDTGNLEAWLISALDPKDFRGSSWELDRGSVKGPLFNVHSKVERLNSSASIFRCLVNSSQPLLM